MIVQLIEVLIGLALVYLIFSTIASALVETVEMIVQKRGKLLEDGIREILAAVSGRRSEADVQQFYDSPFISSLFRDSYKAGDRKLPSYIPPERFADAILQLARNDNSTFMSFAQRMADTIPGAAKDLEQIRAQCIRYFNESMERVSGWYQRYARWWLIVIGLCIAAVGNVDTLQIVHTLSQDDVLREQVVEEATRQASKSMANSPAASIDAQRVRVKEQLQLVDSLGLPIGWSQSEVCAVFGWNCPKADQDGAANEEAGCLDFLTLAPFWFKLFGVLLTTFALTFGAPFWFDLLNQLVNLRTSLKPKAPEAEKTTGAPENKPEGTPEPTGG